jgi:LPXTG-motif cell wall-anchored protein
MAKTMPPSQTVLAQGNWFHAHLPQVALLMAAGGFGVTHVGLMLIGHHEKTQVVALGVCSLGLLMSLLGMAGHGIWRKIVLGLLVLVALEGFVGTVTHRFGDPAQHAGEAAMADVSPATGNTSDPDLSITGLALLASVAIAARKKA